MGTLQEQLIKKGLAVASSLEGSGEKERTAEMKHLKSFGFQKITAVVRSVDDLDKCETVREFKESSKEVLLYSIEKGQIYVLEQVDAVVKKAHLLKDREGSKRLIGMMYALRDLLKASCIDTYERNIRQAFRKSGGVVNLPDENNFKKKGKGR